MRTSEFHKDDSFWSWSPVELLLTILSSPLLCTSEKLQTDLKIGWGGTITPWNFHSFPRFARFSRYEMIPTPNVEFDVSKFRDKSHARTFRFEAAGVILLAELSLLSLSLSFSPYLVIVKRTEASSRYSSTAQDERQLRLNDISHTSWTRLYIIILPGTFSVRQDKRRKNLASCVSLFFFSP